MCCAKALPFNESLLFEAVRALNHDMAYMLTAAQRCGEVDKIASASSPRTGGCQNIVLDDITPSFTAGYQKYVDAWVCPCVALRCVVGVALRCVGCSVVQACFDSC